MSAADEVPPPGKRVRKRDRIRKALAEKADAIRGVVEGAFGLPSGLPDAERLVPLVEGGVEWKGDQAYPESGFARDPVTGRFDKDGVFEVKNLRWGYTAAAPGAVPRAIFRRTRIDTRSVVRASIVFYSFTPHRYAGHAVLLLEFADPEALRDLEAGGRSRGLVVSIEPRTKQGQNWGFFQSFFGPLPLVPEYPLIFVLGTWEDYQQLAFGMYKRRYLSRYELDLDAGELDELVAAALTAALTDHRDKAYHLTRSSCTTHQFDLLNGVVDPARRVKRRFLKGLVIDPRVSVPTRIPTILKKHGLLRGEPVRIENPARG